VIQYSEVNNYTLNQNNQNNFIETSSEQNTGNMMIIKYLLECFIFFDVLYLEDSVEVGDVWGSKKLVLLSSE
jgi:hypothetical protein